MSTASPKKRSRKWWFVAGSLGVLVVAVLALWLSLPDVRPLTAANPTTTRMIELRRKQAADARRPFHLRWTWQPLSRISPLLQRAVVFAEDAEFAKHDGVDWKAIEEAAEHDWRERSLERGASTITQQVGKNLYLSPSRNPIRKLRELFIARRLDRELGKTRVLELYLNIAEWGDGIFGAEAASRRWFGCSAAELRPAQAARLAVALPNPRTRSPAVASRALTRKAARLVRALARAGLVDDAALVEADRELGVALPATETTPPSAPPPFVDEPVIDENNDQE